MGDAPIVQGGVEDAVGRIGEAVIATVAHDVKAEPLGLRRVRKHPDRREAVQTLGVRFRRPVLDTQGSNARVVGGHTGVAQRFDLGEGVRRIEEADRGSGIVVCDVSPRHREGIGKDRLARPDPPP